MGANGNDAAAERPVRRGLSRRVGRRCSAARTTRYPRMTVALVLWLGGIHLNVVLVLASLFLFPIRVAALVVAFQLLFMLIPLNDKDKWGRKIARFICRYAMEYFPINLHVEDYKTFDPNRTYVFSYEPHSVLPIGVAALADLVGFMPLPKIKVLASSAVAFVKSRKGMVELRQVSTMAFAFAEGGGRQGFQQIESCFDDALKRFDEMARRGIMPNAFLDKVALEFLGIHSE
ncbi:hypothetical protein E2562_005557 [Oryza meyeriana var. granulata]|uniref:Diacylglycerol O-acyltransferase n=1 Tax=Oryza meyeriana var. granulata TaxID=110450 RepID=A0A6G1F451_9ORYZ|nr:hypothetical protein E2562_005557 [Oryza meyeriana var. granulata]